MWWFPSKPGSLVPLLHPPKSHGHTSAAGLCASEASGPIATTHPELACSLMRPCTVFLVAAPRCPSPGAPLWDRP